MTKSASRGTKVHIPLQHVTDKGEFTVELTRYCRRSGDGVGM